MSLGQQHGRVSAEQAARESQLAELAVAALGAGQDPPLSGAMQAGPATAQRPPLLQASVLLLHAAYRAVALATT